VAGLERDGQVAKGVTVVQQAVLTEAVAKAHAAAAAPADSPTPAMLEPMAVPEMLAQTPLIRAPVLVMYKVVYTFRRLASSADGPPREAAEVVAVAEPARL
jgi:hypothetical protein